MLSIHKESQIPLYEQIYLAIKKQIETGSIRSGEKIPSKRKMAEYHNVSQITVQNAYAQLVAEGYIYAVPKSGYFVEQIEPLENETTAKETPVPVTRSYAKHYEYDMGTNAVDTNSFPFSTWAKIARQVLTKNNMDILNASHPQGLYELRKEISVYLRQYRGVHTRPEQIVLGSGYEYLLVILIQLLGRDSVYAIEDPGYHKIYRILMDNHLAVRLIGLDDQGLSISMLRADDANIVQVSPSHQFPTGIVMPASRRSALLSWANECGDRYIIESDYDSEFRFSTNPLPACQSLYGNEKVIYMNTFSKSLAPSLRMSYMVLPPALLELYIKKFMYYACTVPNFEQYIMCEFFKGGYFERHLHRMSKIYKKKRDILIQEMIQSPLGPKIEFISHESGLHLLMKIKNGKSEKELVFDAEKAGIRLYGISSFFHSNECNNDYGTIVVGYTGLSQSALIEAAQRLIMAWDR